MQAKQEKWVKTRDFKDNYFNPMTNRGIYSSGNNSVEMFGYDCGSIWISFTSTDKELYGALREGVESHQYKHHGVPSNKDYNLIVNFSQKGKMNIEKIHPYLQLLNKFINIEQIMDELINKIIYLYLPDFDSLLAKEAYDDLFKFAKSTELTFVKWFIATQFKEAQETALAIELYGDIPEESSYYKLANEKIEQLINEYENEVPLNQNEKHVHLEAKFRASLRQDNPELQGVVDNRFAELCGNSLKPQIKCVKPNEETLLNIARHINSLNKRISDLEKSLQGKEHATKMPPDNLRFFNPTLNSPESTDEIKKEPQSFL